MSPLYSSHVRTISRIISPVSRVQRYAKWTGTRTMRIGLLTFGRDQPYKFFKCERLRSNGIEHSILFLPNSLDNESCHVCYIDWPDAVVAITGNSEHRETVDKPSDVVDENIFETKDDRGPHNGVRETRPNHSLFQLSFPAVVTQRRLKRWVGDADVHNAPDPGVLRGSDQSARVVTAVSKVVFPRGNRTQYVLISVEAPWRASLNCSGRSKA